MYSSLVTTSYCCSRLPSTLTTSAMPKIESINRRLTSQCSTHIRSGKPLEKPGYYRLIFSGVTIHLRLILYSKPFYNCTGNCNLHVYSIANESKLMCICNHLHVDLSPISFRFFTIYMQICYHLHVNLSLALFRVVIIFLWICYNLCVYLSQVLFISVPMFIWICEEMQRYMIQICHNIYVVLSKAAHQHKFV